MEALIEESIKVIREGRSDAVFTWMESGAELDEIPAHDETLKAIKTLSEALVAIPTTTSETRWFRGFGREADEHIRIVGTRTSTLIASVAADHGVAECYGNVWEVIVPAGEQVIYISVLREASPERRWWPTIDAEREALVGVGTFTRLGGSTLLFRGVGWSVAPR